MVDLLPRGRTRPPVGDPLAGGDEIPRGPPQRGRRQRDLRGPVPLLFSPLRNLFRLHGHFLEPVSRRDAGKDAALLLPHAAAARAAGGRQVRGGPGFRAGAVRGQHGALVPPDRPPLRPGLNQLGSYVLVTALACIGYGAVFLMCGILFRNPMIPAAVVWVWENLNPFLPTLLKKISVIFYLKNLCPVEIPIPPPFNVMVIDADPTPFWIAVPGLLALSLILLVYSGLSARHTEISYGE